MGISFHKLENLLTERGKTFYSLRKDKIVGTETIKKLQQGYGIIDTRTISNLCEYLNCQPGDLMEYIPDEDAFINRAMDETMERDTGKALAEE